MVKFSGTPLDRTFAALADPTRRALLTRLAEQPDLSVSTPGWSRAPSRAAR
jgi:DNA-binding transcriptional ArsR family regulator